MSEFNTAADAVRKLAKLYEPLVAAAKVLDGLDSLENAKTERERAIAELDQKLAVARGELAQVESTLANAKAQADNMLTVARANAASASNNASVAARRLKEASERQAKEIVQAAEDDAQRQRSAAAADAAAVRGELSQLSEVIETLKAECTALQGTKAALTGEIDALRQRLQGVMG